MFESPTNKWSLNTVDNVVYYAYRLEIDGKFVLLNNTNDSGHAHMTTSPADDIIGHSSISK